MTWLFLTISRFQEIREFLDNIQHLKKIKQILNSYRIFQRGNAAVSKPGWFELITHKKSQMYDKSRIQNIWERLVTLFKRANVTVV